MTDTASPPTSASAKWRIPIGATLLGLVAALLLASMGPQPKRLDLAPFLLPLGRALAFLGFVGFGLSAARAIPPVRATFDRLPGWARVASAVVAGTIAGGVLARLAPVVLFFLSGLLAAQVIERAARRLARPPAFATRRPGRFSRLLALALVALVIAQAAVGSVLRESLASDLPPLEGALDVGAVASVGGALLLLALPHVPRLAGSGSALARRAMTLAIASPPFGWYLGWVSERDAPSALLAPALVAALALGQAGHLLLRVRARVQEPRLAWARRGSGDLLLALAFSVLYAFASGLMETGSAWRAIGEMRDLTGMGLALGATLAVAPRLLATIRARPG